MKNLNFCPRNKVLHTALMYRMQDSLPGFDVYYIDLVIHHVTCISDSMLQIEYEKRYLDLATLKILDVEFGRTYLQH